MAQTEGKWKTLKCEKDKAKCLLEKIKSWNPDILIQKYLPALVCCAENKTYTENNFSK